MFAATLLATLAALLGTTVSPPPRPRRTPRPRKALNPGERFTFQPPDFHRNEGCPSSAEVFGSASNPNGFSAEDYSVMLSWPLHLKNVLFAKLDRISVYAFYRGKKDMWDALKRILVDPSFYGDLAFDPTYRPKMTFTQEDVNTMVARRFAEILPPGVKPRGWVRMFWVPEAYKEPPRRRVISHTVTANEAARTTTCKLPTNEDKFRLLGRGSYGISFDFSQCFSAYEYAEEVRNYMCFYGPDGQLYRLRRLAMGQKHSCDIAQFVLELVLQEACEMANVDPAQTLGHIDNGLMVGSFDEVERFTAALKGVCDTLHIELNDRESLVPVQVLDFTGWQLDLAAKTYKLSQKTVTKATHMAEVLRQHTAKSLPIRSLASAFGVCMYTHASFRANGRPGAATRYNTCRFASRWARACAEDPDLWDHGWVDLPPEVTAELVEWLDDIARNEPSSVCLNNLQEITHILVADAMKGRFGAILIRLADNSFEIAVGNGPVGFSHSTQTEPWGLEGAISSFVERRLISPTDKVLMLMDHTGFVDANKKGFSPNWHYNTVINLLRQRGAPWATAPLGYIPGEANCADEPSRGKPVDPEKVEALILRFEVARETGTAEGDLYPRYLPSSTPLISTAHRGPD